MNRLKLLRSGGFVKRLFRDSCRDVKGPRLRRCVLVLLATGVLNLRAQTGTLDTNFAPVITGYPFVNINNVNVFAVCRLLTNGVVDATFTTSVDYVAFTAVFSLALQSNGKVFMGGSFVSIGGVGQPSFARLNANGTLDTSFVPDLPNNGVNAVGLQSSGNVILAGPFLITDAHGNSQFGVARLHGDAVSPPQRPLLSNSQSLPGAFRFTINGEVGRTYIILGTTNFSGWTPLATQMQSSASQSFTDSSVSNATHRSYRALVAQ
jgi:hypothetical protein